jgi:Rrf2 family protein
VQITARGEYAVRAVIAAAGRPGDAPATATAVSADEHIPLGYLYSILGDLRRAELVTTFRGHAGGYRLARPAGDITVGEVLRAVADGADGIGAPARRLAAQPVPHGGVDRLWASIRTVITDIVDHTTIADVIADLSRVP